MFVVSERGRRDDDRGDETVVQQITRLICEESRSRRSIEMIEVAPDEMAEIETEIVAKIRETGDRSLRGDDDMGAIHRLTNMFALHHSAGGMWARIHGVLVVSDDETSETKAHRDSRVIA